MKRLHFEVYDIIPAQVFRSQTTIHIMFQFKDQPRDEVLQATSCSQTPDEKWRLASDQFWQTDLGSVPGQSKMIRIWKTRPISDSLSLPLPLALSTCVLDIVPIENVMLKKRWAHAPDYVHTFTWENGAPFGQKNCFQSNATSNTQQQTRWSQWEDTIRSHLVDDYHRHLRCKYGLPTRNWAFRPSTRTGTDPHMLL